jgi:flagellar biosynthesis protein
MNPPSPARPPPDLDGTESRAPQLPPEITLTPTLAWPVARGDAHSPEVSSAATPALRAVALRYDPFAGPPRVIASGRGYVAEALLARAREAGVPIEAQPELVNVLMRLRVDQVVPPALFVAVAQVLAWAYQVDARVGRAQIPMQRR